MGDLTIYGELYENSSKDQGLEIKFLFGKKRIVYEWYDGENFARADETGGPYARVEAAFYDVVFLNVAQAGLFATLTLSFATEPTLSKQTTESMEKFKVRSQQRQYERVAQDNFPVKLTKEAHQIWMPFDDAQKASKLITDESPYLPDTRQSEEDVMNIDPKETSQVKP